MPLLAHLFVYRLIAAKWPHHINFYNAKSCFLLVVLTIGIESSLWFFNCYFNYDADTEMANFVKPFLDRNFPGEGQGFIGALYYNSNGEFRLRPFLGSMGFNTIMSICMSVIVFCSFSIVTHFRKELRGSCTNSISLCCETAPMFLI
ncbi:hypothetical protein PMAYCL1PPCAC_16966 [Pristionchus mayeri]|uniref:G protein-coupled receptor n=1 Tax=Pristionchus mayeri TaxID=1317129 RepID=A0AAN5I0E2_9BILA|nr:hypothetical protein PMAYCL1PPCAC_16966 [Pristionchus mayeri]